MTIFVYSGLVFQMRDMYIDDVARGRIYIYVCLCVALSYIEPEYCYTVIVSNVKAKLGLKESANVIDTNKFHEYTVQTISSFTDWDFHFIFM